MVDYSPTPAALWWLLQKWFVPLIWYSETFPYPSCFSHLTRHTGSEMNWPVAKLNQSSLSKISSGGNSWKCWQTLGQPPWSSWLSLTAAWVRSHLAALGCEDPAPFSSGCCRRTPGLKQIFISSSDLFQGLGGQLWCGAVLLLFQHRFSAPVWAGWQLGAVLQEKEQPGWECCSPKPWHLTTGRSRSMGLQTAGVGWQTHCKITPFPLDLGKIGRAVLCLCVSWRQELPWHGGDDPEMGSGGQNMLLITPGFGAPSLWGPFTWELVWSLWAPSSSEFSVIWVCCWKGGLAPWARAVRALQLPLSSAKKHLQPNKK